MSPYRIEETVQPGFDQLINAQDGVAVLLKRVGGELIGYDVQAPGLNRSLPLLWNNRRERSADDAAWPGHATVLFPIVGGLKEGRSRCGEELITQRVHGIAQESLFQLADATASQEGARLTYRLAASEATRHGYPYDFGLDLTYALRGRDLTLTFKVTNVGERTMFFQCGWHPGFNTELGLGGRRKDWQLLFKQGVYHRHHCLSDGSSLLTGQRSTLELNGALSLSESDYQATTFLEIPDPLNRTCTLINRKLSLGLILDFPDFPHLALWADRGYDFICIEPCQGIDDHVRQEPFERKQGIVALRPGHTACRSATIRPLLSLASLGQGR